MRRSLLVVTTGWLIAGWGVLAEDAPVAENLNPPDSGYVQRIITTEDTAYLGKIVGREGNIIVFQTLRTREEILVSDILSVEQFPVRVPLTGKEVEGNLRIPAAGYVQILTLKNNTTWIGRVTDKSEEKIDFETAGRVEVVPIPLIKSIKQVPETDIRRGKYWFPDPNRSRMYAGPTGYPLNRGQGNVAAYYLLVPLVSYGITDNLTVAGGAAYMGVYDYEHLVAGVYLLPRVGIRLGQHFAVSAGGAAGYASGFGDFNPVMFAAYGVGTFSTCNLNLTAGGGYGFYKGTGPEWVEGFSSTPAFIVGADYRLLPWLSVVTENYLVRAWTQDNPYSPLMSYGIRFFGERYSLDVAFIKTRDFGWVLGFPFVAIVYHFD